MPFILQGTFWGKIRYHIFPIYIISLDTQVHNRKNMLGDKRIMTTLNGEFESCFSQKLCIDQNIMKGHFCLKVNI
jgi:hypothetical protein